MWQEYDEDEIAEMLAYQTLERETGALGENVAEATSPAASPSYYGPGAVRYIAHHRVNQAEAAVELYQETNKDDLPRGAQFYVERVEYG